MANSAAVETFDLTKKFGSLNAVNNIDLTINKEYCNKQIN